MQHPYKIIFGKTARLRHIAFTSGFGSLNQMEPPEIESYIEIPDVLSQGHQKFLDICTGLNQLANQCQTGSRVTLSDNINQRSEERRVGKECKCQWKAEP